MNSILGFDNVRPFWISVQLCSISIAGADPGFSVDSKLHYLVQLLRFSTNLPLLSSK